MTILVVTLTCLLLYLVGILSMNGSRIIVASEPRGIFLEGTISGTPYPGTVMQVGTASPVSGEFTYVVYAPTSDGDPRLWVVLLEDELQGTPFSTAYVTGTRGFLYVPIPGEHMNMLVAGEQATGSANVYTIGERLIAQHNTGLLIAATSSTQAAPFTVLENITLTADVQGWVWCMRT